MKKNKIFGLPIASNLGSALTETMKSVSQHEGGIKQGEINLPNFKEEVIKTEEDVKIFVETMENTPEPNDKLKKAFKDFNKQETFKQDTLNHFLSTSNVIVKDSQKFDYKNIVLPKEFRQETLEEAKVNNLINLFGKDYDLEPRCVIESCNDSLIYGVNWQQEQDKNKYSKEEVLEIIDSLFKQYASSFRIDAKEHFLQFKKK